MIIYRVVFEKHDIDRLINRIEINTFFNKKNALKYLKESIATLKKQNEKNLDMEDYSIEETEESYEVYLSGRQIEEGMTIWLEADKTLDEIEKDIKEEKENEYEK